MVLRCDPIGTGLFTAQDLFPDRSRRVLKNTLLIGLFKNVQMQGAQVPRNETYMDVR